MNRDNGLTQSDYDQQWLQSVVDKHDAFVQSHEPSASELQTWTILRNTLLTLRNTVRDVNDEAVRIHDQLMMCLTERNAARAQLDNIQSMVFDYLNTTEDL